MSKDTNPTSFHHNSTHHILTTTNEHTKTSTQTNNLLTLYLARTSPSLRRLFRMSLCRREVIRSDSWNNNNLWVQFSACWCHLQNKMTKMAIISNKLRNAQNTITTHNIKHNKSNTTRTSFWCNSLKSLIQLSKWRSLRPANNATKSKKQNKTDIEGNQTQSESINKSTCTHNNRKKQPVWTIIRLWCILSAHQYKLLSPWLLHMLSITSSNLSAALMSSNSLNSEWFLLINRVDSGAHRKASSSAMSSLVSEEWPEAMGCWGERRQIWWEIFQTCECRFTRANKYSISLNTL